MKPKSLKSCKPTVVKRKASAIPFDSVAKKMRKAGIVGGLSIRKEEHPWDKDRPTKEQKQANQTNPYTAGMDKKRPVGVGSKGKPSKKALAVTSAELMVMAKDKAGGMTNAELSEKYGVSEGYVGEALRTLFVRSRTGREILKGVLLENAVACGMRVRKTVDELTPMQAVVATGIMAQRFVDLDKHTQNQPPDINFDELNVMGAMLKDIRNSVGIGQTEGDVIDIQAEVEVQSSESSESAD